MKIRLTPEIRAFSFRPFRAWQTDEQFSLYIRILSWLRKTKTEAVKSFDGFTFDIVLVLSQNQNFIKTKTSKPKPQNQNQCQNQNSKPKPMSKPKLQNQNHLKTKTIKTKRFGFGACLIRHRSEPGTPNPGMTEFREVRVRCSRLQSVSNVDESVWITQLSILVPGMAEPRE